LGNTRRNLSVTSRVHMNQIMLHVMYDNNTTCIPKIQHNEIYIDVPG